MAILTASAISEIVSRGERVFDNRHTVTEHDINVASEIPNSDPVIPNPIPVLNADGNAIAIRGKAITTATPVNGDFLRYDSTNEKWIYSAGAGGGGGTTITVRAVDGTPTNPTSTLQFEELDGFVPSVTGLETTSIGLANIPVAKLAALTASRAVVTDINGKISSTSTPSTKLAFLDNVTSDIQTQINALSAGAGITALTGDVTASGSGSVAATLSNTGISAGTYTRITFDAKGRATVGANLQSGDLPAHTSTHNISGLAGTSISSPTSGQLLQYNGTNWVNATVSSSGGTANTFRFTVTFNGTDGNPASVSSLPAGWSSAIAGNIITITHDQNKQPAFVTYLGYTTGNTQWNMRLPSAANPVYTLEASKNTQFKLTLTTSIAGADLSQDAQVTVIF